MSSRVEFLKFDYNGRELLVSADYYMVDGIRTPVGLREALTIADDMGCELPTKEVVDFIWKSANIKLEPTPMKPGPQMTSPSYYKYHNQIIENQLEKYKPLKGKLIAGHKKDILYSPYNSKRVKIYGWHRLNGYPIQPVSTVHHHSYYDYSHGLRLIKYVT